MNSEVKNSIIKDSKQIHSLLMKRIEQLKLKPAGMIKDAETHNMKIDSSSFSRYLKSGNVKGSLSEEAIVWLCTRYGIDLMLLAGTPKIVDGKLKIELPPYSEVLALSRLKLIFG